MSFEPHHITDVEQADEHTQDLLIERTLWGLDAAHETELSVALSDVDATAYSIERAVGAIFTSMADQDPMPASLRSKLDQLADSVSDTGIPSETSSANSSAAHKFAEASAQSKMVEADVVRLVGSGVLDDSRPAKTSPVQWLGWVAAAACLVFAMLMTTPRSGDTVRGGPNVVAQLASFESTATDLMRAGWAGLSAIGAPNHELDQSVSGEVVWSDAKDTGFMTISGIAPNDPDEFQYQLWIFDAERRTGDLPQFQADEISPLLTQRPVDGGVFDVVLNDNGEVIVPIDAKLPVGKGVIFAVTKEQPGGVVVSDRDIVFLALRG